MRQALERAMDTLSNVLRTIGGVLLLLATLLIFVATLTRYLFSFSIVWAEEACRMMVLAASFMLAGHMETSKGQVYLSIVIDKIKNPKVLKILDYIKFATAAVVGGLIAYWGFIQFVLVKGQLTYSETFPRQLPAAILPIGMTILVLYCVAKIVLMATDKTDGSDEYAQAANARKEGDGL